VVLLGFMCFVNLNQALTIQKQRTELVAQFKTLIVSQQHEVKMGREVSDQENKFEEALKTCKK